jgi:hypothetical protein
VNGRARGQRSGIAEHRGSKAEIERPLAGREGAEHTRDPRRHQEARHPAGRGQHQRLDDRLPHHLPAAGADRQASRDLAAAAEVAGEQEAAQVRRRDQEHQRDRGEQQARQPEALRPQRRVDAQQGLDHETAHGRLSRRVGTGRAPLLRTEEAPASRLEPEDGEVLRRDHRAQDLLLRAARRLRGRPEDQRRHRVVRRQAGERPHPLAVVAEVRQRQRMEAGAVAGLVDPHQPVRPRHRQRSQEGRVDPAKDRRVRTDAEGEGQHRERGEAGRAREAARGVA